MNKMTSKEDSIANTEVALAYHSKLFWLAKALWHTVEQDWQVFLRKYDLTINEYSILRVVAKNNSSRVTDISSYSLIHISTALNSSQKLKKRGLVHLEKDVEDTRVTIVTITAEGRELLNELDCTINFKDSLMEKNLVRIADVIGVKPNFSDTQSIVFSVYGEKLFEYFSNAIE